MKRYKQVADGELIQLTQSDMRRGVKVGCCDCNLIHRMYFTINSRGLRMYAIRDNRATAAMRRGRA